MHMRPGFSAIELIIVIGMFLIVVVSVMPFLARFQQRETLGTTAEDVLQTLQRARTRALIGERDSAWGVQFQAGSYVLYAGNSYALRQTALDEVHNVSAISFSGLPQITFRKLFGTAMTGGTLTLTQSLAGAKTITVNSAGMISLP